MEQPRFSPGAWPYKLRSGGSNLTRFAPLIHGLCRH
ncbi:hypothetical protein R20943_07137 [Paraburkholderia aspalathi]|nr:hypothetical protein R20943_07137 [Paraburkholderia aspalathi]